MGEISVTPSDHVTIFLTFRQQQVLQLAVDDHSAKEIARELLISVRTVEGHFANLRSLAGVSTLPGLTAWAVAQGIARPTQNGVRQC
jgi:DNA-binding NarL/FixJ family response regulator